MKYADSKVVFREIPDEVTLAINISNCPVKCPGCHSSYLVNDVGEPLDYAALSSLIESNPGITCVSFMGGDGEPRLIHEFAKWIKSTYKGLKVSWYSGRDLDNARQNLDVLDYVKVGPFIDEYGPLDNPNTNQRFYAVTQTPDGPKLEDWTKKFLKKFI